jgi:hypothetical protein
MDMQEWAIGSLEFFVGMVLTHRTPEEVRDIVDGAIEEAFQTRQRLAAAGGIHVSAEQCTPDPSTYLQVLGGEDAEG